MNFVDDLKDLAEQRSAVGLTGDWTRSLYNDPMVLLLEPEGGMRQVLSHKGLSARNVLGNTLRELHLAVPPEGRELSTAEAEAVRQSLYNENVRWSKVLEEDESLRQPTRYWFDGFGVGPKGAPLLAGVENAALPEAIDRFLEEGVLDDDDDEEPLVSSDGVQAPEWYARAKRTAEKKQAAERKLWNGTAPSASAGPLPLGPAGARLAPVKGYTRKALQEANVAQRRLVSAFFAKYGGDEFKFLSGEGAAEATKELEIAESGGGATPGDATTSPPRTETTESALLRAEMLALGLSRSATSSQSTRRLRLLQELEKSVGELEAEGFEDKRILGRLKEQIRTSYASAPEEFVAEARKANLFNEYAPPMTLSEIAAEFKDIASSRIEKVSKGLEQGLVNAEWEALDPLRKRGPREKGNRIEINKPK